MSTPLSPSGITPSRCLRHGAAPLSALLRSRSRSGSPLARSPWPQVLEKPLWGGVAMNSAPYFHNLNLYSCAGREHVQNCEFFYMWRVRRIRHFSGTLLGTLLPHLSALGLAVASPGKAFEAFRQAPCSNNTWKADCSVVVKTRPAALVTESDGDSCYTMTAFAKLRDGMWRNVVSVRR